MSISGELSVMPSPSLTKWTLYFSNSSNIAYSASNKKIRVTRVVILNDMAERVKNGITGRQTR